MGEISVISEISVICDQISVIRDQLKDFSETAEKITVIRD